MYKRFEKSSRRRSQALTTLEEISRRAERQHIRAVLARAGRVEDAAKLLGVSRSTLFEKIRKLDMRTGL
jgi:transcriptional regulator with PAS, ATPase and Fis domain